MIENTLQGRRGAGTQNHCMDGKEAIIEDILDWRPFDHVTLTTPLPAPGAPKILMFWSFDERADGGTLFELRFGKLKAKDLPFFESIWPSVREKFYTGIRASPGTAGGADERGGPRGAAAGLCERFVTQPEISAAGGRILVRGIPAAIYEAGLQQRTVVIEFDSVEQARAAHDSPGISESAGRSRRRRRTRHSHRRRGVGGAADPPALAWRSAHEERIKL